MSGTDRAHSTIVLRACYSVSGTNTAYGATREARAAEFKHEGRLSSSRRQGGSCIILCGRYAMSRHSCMILRVCHAMCGTERGYGATRLKKINSFVLKNMSGGQVLSHATFLCAP
eukprot:3941018-Rhodomonas_salina.5